MDEENLKKLPDDLNNWSKENFQDAIDMFKKVVDKNKKKFYNEVPEKKAEKKAEENLPDREVPIQQDDLLNLKIMLERSQSVDDFIKQM